MCEWKSVGKVDVNADGEGELSNTCFIKDNKQGPWPCTTYTYLKTLPWGIQSMDSSGVIRLYTNYTKP